MFDSMCLNLFTSKVLGELYDITKLDISYYLKNIFKDFELQENSVVKKYLTIEF